MLYNVSPQQRGGSGTGQKQILWYIVKRALILAVVLLLIATIDFATYRVFSDDGLIPHSPNPVLNQMIIEEYHLNHSIQERYLMYMWNTMTLDFGHSISYAHGQPVADLAYPALERSLWLFGVVGALAILTGVLYEAFASSIRTKSLRTIMRLVALGFLAIPSMGLAGLWQDMISRSGLPIPLFASPYSPELHGEGAWVYFTHNLSSGFIPALTLILLAFGFISMFYRRSAGDGVTQANLRKGAVAVSRTMLSDRWPVKFYFAWIVSCALLIDVFFNYRGLGTLLWNSLWYSDLLLSMTTFLFIGAVLAISNCALDISAVLILRKTDSMFSDTEVNKGGPTSDARHLGTPPSPFSIQTILAEYLRSKAGLAALVVFAAIVVIALAAPSLSTVSDPNLPNHYEPSYPSNDWINPLKPSMDQSPYTGYKHPLGTDFKGMDVYSAMLYGSREALVSCVIIGLLSFIIGFLAAFVGAFLSRSSGLLVRSVSLTANTIGDTFVAIPLMIILIGPLVDPGLDYYFISASLALAILLWASVFVAHRVGLRIKEYDRTLGSSHPVGTYLPTILAETLYVTKLAVTIGLLSVFSIQFLGFYDVSTISWGGLIESSFERNMFITGVWWCYLPPIVGVCLLVMSAFVIVDTLERSVRKREGDAQAVATQSSAITTA